MTDTERIEKLEELSTATEAVWSAIENEAVAATPGERDNGVHMLRAWCNTCYAAAYGVSMAEYHEAFAQEFPYFQPTADEIQSL